MCVCVCVRVRVRVRVCVCVSMYVSQLWEKQHSKTSLERKLNTAEV